MEELKQENIVGFIPTLYLSRDKNGVLTLTDSKPFNCQDKYWLTSGGFNMRISPLAFPEVTFENSPVKVKLIKDDSEE